MTVPHTPPDAGARRRRVPRARRRRLLLLFLVAPAASGCGVRLPAPAADGSERAGAAGLTPTEAGLRSADSAVALWVREERIPGAVLRVSRNGRVLVERAYGYARLYEMVDGEYDLWRDPRPRRPLRRLDPPVAMTPSTAFDLASVTKVMATTMAVMALVSDGAVDVDAPVRTYLPEFRGGGREAVTVRHLLTHRAGLPQWVPLYYRAADADAAWRALLDLPLRWPVGEGRHYSDLGFMALGRLVEAVSGRALDAYVAERIYRPLGLERTGFRRRGGDPASAGEVAATSHGNPFEYRMVHDSTFGYRIDGDPDAWNGWRHRTLVGEVNDGNAYHAWGGVAGHAGLFSTASDLDRLLRLLLDGGEMDGVRILDADVVLRFLEPGPEGQALGWRIPDFAPPGSFFHTGFTGTFVLGARAGGVAVVLLTNRQNGGLAGDGRYPDVGPLQEAVVRALTSQDSP